MFFPFPRAPRVPRTLRPDVISHCSALGRGAWPWALVRLERLETTQPVLNAAAGRQLGQGGSRGIFRAEFSWDFAGILNFGGVILMELMDFLDFWWFWWVESCWKQSNGWLHLVANLQIGWIWWHFFCWIQHSELWCTEVLLSVWSGVLMIVDWYFVWVSHNPSLRFLWKPPWLPAFKVQGLP